MIVEPEQISIIRKQAKTEAASDTNAVWVYGSRAQSKLMEFSRTVSKSMISNKTDQAETLLMDVIAKLDSSVLQKKGLGLFNKGIKNAVKQYWEMLQCIEDLSVCLRLQQAQLLKEIFVFERMEELITRCSRELEIYIEEGEKRLTEGFPAQEKQWINEAAFGQTNHEGDDDWAEQFKRKLDELRTTHIVSMQSATQIKLLKHNDTLLVERIGHTLSIIIPLWRNQTMIAYRLEQYDREKKNQDNVVAKAQKAITENDKTILQKIGKKTAPGSDDIDYEAVRRSNEKLQESLNSLVLEEQKMRDDEEGMNSILLQL